MSDGMLSLSWNNHKATFCHILSTLREKERYTDVTVACEGRFYPVHKLVLSTCSEYFEKIFDNTPCKHPVIVLKDIASDELEALLSYMYDGVVSVAQNDLARLIKAAEVLRIKGLAVPDEPPPPKNDVSTRKSAQSRNSSDDRSSPHPKRRRREENTSTHSATHSSPPSSPSRVSPIHIDTEPIRTQTDKRWTDHSEEQKTDRPLDDRLHHPASTTSSSPTPNIEVMVDETLVKEEIDDPSDNRDDILDSGMDYGSLGSDSRLDGSLGGEDDGQMLPNKYEQKVASAQNQQLPESVVEALAGPSGMQGWLGGCEVPGSGFSGMEGYSGESSQDVHPPQQGGPAGAAGGQSQAHQMVGPPSDRQSLEELESAVTRKQFSQRRIHHCSFCSYSTTRSDSLKHHLYIHTGEKPYSCQFCSYSCTNKTTLAAHMRRHTGEKPFACPHCPYRAIQKVPYVQCDSRKAYGRRNPTRFPTGISHDVRVPKIHHCIYCSYTTRKVGHLKEHMYTHTGEKPFTCPYCHVSTTNQTNLKAHIRRHTGEKPHACPYCQYRAIQKSTLKTHLLTHRSTT